MRPTSGCESAPSGACITSCVLPGATLSKGPAVGNRTVEITEANFKETVEKGGITILDFWAEWCGPCKAFAPIFEKAAEQHTDVTFGKINTDVEQGLAGAFEIRSIPTIMVFRDRVLLFSQPG